ncbi:MAG: trypsin-like peptidase domain-containing protein [Pyrinomonadaceae bacterium]
MHYTFRRVLGKAVVAAVTFGLHATPILAQSTAGNGISGTTATLPERLSDSFAAIAKKVEPAVVSIENKGRLTAPISGASAGGDLPDDVMEYFRRQMPRRPSISVGSGFIIDKAGHIMTNAHVIIGASKLTVTLESGEEYPATVVGFDDETDLAVLHIDAAKDLPFVKFGNSDIARVGEWVLGIGSPFGLTRSVTAGIISQTRRETTSTSFFQKFIQTDAAINKGNSGGPLVNMDGEVIGIISQIATSTGDFNGVGFAFPSTEAAAVRDQILQNGKVRRGYLGAVLESVKPEYAKIYGLTETMGAIVIDVRSDRAGPTPAAIAGLKAGDVIVEFAGEHVQSAQDLIARVSSKAPGEAINLTYYREAGSGVERKTASLKLTERPPQRSAVSTSLDPTSVVIEPNPISRPFGLTLAEPTASATAKYKLEGLRGAIVTDVDLESYIADVRLSNGNAALVEGDLIQRVNREPVSDIASFIKVVKKLKKGDPVVMNVLYADPSANTPQLKIVQFTVQ